MILADMKDLASAMDRQYDFRPGQMDRLITQESGWNPQAVSPAGAFGLTQFMPATAQEWNVSRDDPEGQIRQGAAYLAYLRDYFDGDMQKAVAAYNWGMGNVERKGLGNMPAETRGYLRNVYMGNQPAGPLAENPGADPIEEQLMQEALIQQAAMEQAQQSPIIPQMMGGMPQQGGGAGDPMMQQMPPGQPPQPQGMGGMDWGGLAQNLAGQVAMMNNQPGLARFFMDRAQQREGRRNRQLKGQVITDAQGRTWRIDEGSRRAEAITTPDGMQLTRAVNDPMQAAIARDQMQSEREQRRYERQQRRDELEYQRRQALADQRFQQQQERFDAESERRIADDIRREEAKDAREVRKGRLAAYEQMRDQLPDIQARREDVQGLVAGLEDGTLNLPPAPILSQLINPRGGFISETALSALPREDASALRNLRSILSTQAAIQARINNKVGTLTDADQQTAEVQVLGAFMANPQQFLQRSLDQSNRFLAQFDEYDQEFNPRRESAPAPLETPASQGNLSENPSEAPAPAPSGSSGGDFESRINDLQRRFDALRNR